MKQELSRNLAVQVKASREKSSIMKVTLTEKKVFSEVNTFNASELDRYAMSIGAIVEKAVKVNIVTTKVVENFNDLIVVIQVEKQSYFSQISQGAMIVMDGTDIDLLYINSEDQLTSWNTGQPATKAQLKAAKRYMLIFYTAGQQKNLAATAINTGYFTDESGRFSRTALDEFLNVMTSGQYNFYKGMELAAPEYANILNRTSTIFSSSDPLVDLAHEANEGSEREEFEPVLNFRVGIKNTIRDGQLYVRASWMARVWNAAYGTHYRPEDFKGMLAQVRPNASIKSAGLVVGDMAYEEIVNAESPEGAKEWFFTKEEVAADPVLKKEIMQCYHGKKGLNHVGTRFNAGDMVIVASLEDYLSLSGDIYMDGNVVKAAFDPIMKTGFNMMNIAKERGFKVGLSGQAQTSSLVNDEANAIKYATKLKQKELVAQTESIVSPKIGVIADIDLVDNAHYNTFARVAFPNAAKHEKRFFQSVAKDIVKGHVRELQKNRVTVGGMYLYAAVDYAHPFGISVVNDDEVFMYDFLRYKNEKSKELSKTKKQLLVLAEKFADDAEKMERINSSLALINFEAEHLASGVVSMYRSPKMSPNEIATRKVVSIDEVARRLKKALKTGKITSGQFEASLDMYKSSAMGVVVLSSYKAVTDLHSGSDWDMDAFTVVFDLGFVDTVRQGIELIFPEVDFERKSGATSTLEEIANMKF